MRLHQCWMTGLIVLAAVGGCAPMGGGNSPPTGSAPTTLVRSNDSIPPAYTGIYSLQALIDFDSLDGALLDLQAGTVSLYGHRAHRAHFVPVAYLDHLATALE